MAFLGSKACHEECGVRIMDYLEGDKSERALAFDCINLGDPDDARGRWAAMMDATRVLAGNHTDWGSKRCVTYQHYVISPDPRDGIDIDTLRDLTMEWAQEFFGTQMDPGRLGSYEVAVVYHDDNERGIPHAHVIVNNTNLEDGRRLHVDIAMSKLLGSRLQEMCEARGLSYFDDDYAEGHAQEAGRYYTKAERKLIREGAFSWKQDIANNVMVARRLSRSEDEFLKMCERFRIGCERKDDDYLYTHYKNPSRWKVSGHRLGRNYTCEAILNAIDSNAKRFTESVSKVRENVCRHVVEDLLEDMEMAAVVSHGERVADVAFTLQVNDKYEIDKPADYDGRIAQYRALLASAREGTERYETLRKRLADLSFARKVSERGAFFEDAGGFIAVRASTGMSRVGVSSGGTGGLERGAGRGGQVQEQNRTRGYSEARGQAPRHDTGRAR